MTISPNDDQNLPTIGITMGDPAGIGPEVCVKAIQHLRHLQDQTKLPTSSANFLLLGDLSVLQETAQRLQVPLTIDVIKFGDFATDPAQITKHNSNVCLVDFQNAASSISIGKVSAAAGQAAFEYIEAAIHAHQTGIIDAMVTGPINKLSLHRAGHDYPGHTELLAIKTNTSDYCMLQYSPAITCSFVTTHCGYLEAVKQMTTERILTVIQLTARAMEKINGKAPRLIVCGLNPHAGEAGLFGDREEERLITPAIEAAQTAGWQVEGPFPPDTCFIASRLQTTDAVVCMYHDQGHIPIKALAFDQAVNTTLGLPIIRTSVDHGTAFDIAGTNRANPSSMLRAIELASKLASNQRVERN